MVSLRCHGDSDCNKIQIIRNFHFYIIQLWQSFFHIFTHSDVINAQTWEVSPQKNPVEPPLASVSCSVKVSVSLGFVPAKAKLPYYRKITTHFLSQKIALI